MFKNKTLNFILGIIIVIFLISNKFNIEIPWNNNKNTFEYQYLDREIQPFNQEFFNSEKEKLIQQIKSSSKSTDEYVLKYRELIQANRCYWVFNGTTKTSVPYNQDLLVSKHDRKSYSPKQKRFLAQYINGCLNLFEGNEDYIELLIRLDNNLEKAEPSTKNGSDLKSILVNRNKFKTVIQKINSETNKLKTKLKSESNIAKQQRLKNQIRTSKNQLKQIRKSQKERYYAILKSTQSPDVIISIIYNYRNNLPRQWYLEILYMLTGIEDKFINLLSENHYFDNLIITSADMYACTLGYPCEENSYNMYFQCLGLRYKENEKACGRNVYDYYFDGFLTENMQVDSLKIIDYYKEYTHE